MTGVFNYAKGSPGNCDRTEPGTSCRPEGLWARLPFVVVVVVALAVLAKCTRELA